MKHYMRTSGGIITSTEDVIEWGRWYENADRLIARDSVGDATVSTVFLSVGPPILFETMIFGGSYDKYQERYICEEDARVRHAEIVRRLREGLPLELEEEA